MFGLAVLGIVVNGIAVLRTRNAVSINERMVSLHLLEDVLGWVAVLIGSVIMFFTGLTIIDPILSIGISCFVLYNVVKNVRQLMPFFLQGAMVDVDRISGILKEIDVINDIHDLHVWALDEEHNILTVHVKLTGSLPMEELAGLKNKIRECLKAEEIEHATIEFELPDELCALADCV
jgi:cobalt-zinc-cadmium efflux system protein